MARRKLIFFTTSDPATDPGGLFRAYHFAGVAASAGLEAEVRLAGDAVTVTNPAALPRHRPGPRHPGQSGRRGRGRLPGLFLTVLQRRPRGDRTEGGGGRGAFRTLAEILTEVADGQSELIFVGG